VQQELNLNTPGNSSFDNQSTNNSNAVGNETEGGKREVVGEKGKYKKGDNGYESDQGDIETLAGTVVKEGCSSSFTDKNSTDQRTGTTGQETVPGPSSKAPSGFSFRKSSPYILRTSSEDIH
jgi:hypothetical protein